MTREITSDELAFGIAFGSVTIGLLIAALVQIQKIRSGQIIPKPVLLDSSDFIQAPYSPDFTSPPNGEKTSSTDQN